MKTINANERYILDIEQRGNKASPIITANVNNSYFYILACIDSTDTFIQWYVRDIHGFDLCKGYDSYKSESGNTLFEWRVPLYDTKGKILLIEQDTDANPSVLRYDHINKNTIIEEVMIVYKEEEDEGGQIPPLSPPWYRTFSSLSRSSVF